MTFVITGDVHHYKNRDEFKAYVESQGGKVAGSVSGKTSYLVNNDVEIDGNIFGENLTEKIALADNIVDRSRIFKEAYETLVYGRPELSDKEKINEYLVSRITRAKGCVYE